LPPGAYGFPVVVTMSILFPYTVDTLSLASANDNYSKLVKGTIL